MTRLKKRRVWITAAITLVTLGILFFPLTNSVGAMFGAEHAVEVMERVEFEIMPLTPAGQYYDGMFWKYSSELMDLLRRNPEHSLKTWQVTDLFIPGLEALLNGRGDTVRITKEQIRLLKVELDWMASVGSPSLRDDIEREKQRFPLENFIGMTFSEALDYVNSNFPPDLAVATQTPWPLPTPWCAIGTDSGCQSTPAPVSEDGQWAYYVNDEIYFEYPSDWRVEQTVDSVYLTLVPAPDSPEGSNSIGNIQLAAAKSPSLAAFQYDPLTFPQTVLQRPDPIWKKLVSLVDFEGSEFLYRTVSENFGLEVIIYDPDTEVCIIMYMTLRADGMDDSIYELENELYPNFQHIMESFRIQNP